MTIKELRCVIRPWAAKVVVVGVFIIGRAHANPQAAPETWRLTKVEVSGLKRYDESRIIALSGLRQGERVDLAAIEAATTRLIETGLFKTLNYRYRALRADIEVVFAAQEAQWSIPVVFDNFIWFSDAEIAAAVEKELPTFDGTAPDSAKAVDSISKVLQRLVQERSLSGQIEYTPSFEAAGRNKQHIFKIEGIKLKLCSLRIAGASAVPENELIKRSKPLLQGEDSRSFLYAFFRENLVPIYRELGDLHQNFR